MPCPMLAGFWKGSGRRWLQTVAPASHPQLRGWSPTSQRFDCDLRSPLSGLALRVVRPLPHIPRTAPRARRPQGVRPQQSSPRIPRRFPADSPPIRRHEDRESSLHRGAMPLSEVAARAGGSRSWRCRATASDSELPRYFDHDELRGDSLLPRQQHLSKIFVPVAAAPANVEIHCVRPRPGIAKIAIRRRRSDPQPPRTASGTLNSTALGQDRSNAPPDMGNAGHGPVPHHLND
jgi:hypothetical protein